MRIAIVKYNQRWRPSTSDGGQRRPISERRYTNTIKLNPFTESSLNAWFVPNIKPAREFSSNGQYLSTNLSNISIIVREIQEFDILPSSRREHIKLGHTTCRSAVNCPCRKRWPDGQLEVIRQFVDLQSNVSRKNRQENQNDKCSRLLARRQRQRSDN